MNEIILAFSEEKQKQFAIYKLPDRKHGIFTSIFLRRKIKPNMYFYSSLYI